MKYVYILFEYSNSDIYLEVKRTKVFKDWKSLMEYKKKHTRRCRIKKVKLR